MADDLDAELLALAGDSSDEEASPPIKESADSPPASSSPRSPEAAPPPTSTTMGRKGIAKPVKSARRARKPKKEEEDGEVSEVDSLQSASMSESESGSDSEGSAPRVENDGPIFAYEKLYHSSKDKQEIMAMPEIQREQLLSERAQQVDRHNQDVALRRLLASREREEARRVKKNKRKASSAGLEDGQRKSSRQKTTLGGRKVGEASDAIEAYKRQREQKGKRDELRRRDPAAKDQRARVKDDLVSDDDAEGESEVEWERERSPSPTKDDPPAELHDVQRTRVGRTNFAQVCFYPGFDDAIIGCYARVNIGPNRDNGQNEYRMCLIKKFSEGRPYAMEGSNGRSFVTTQYAILAHGKAEREFPFIACSDSPFSEGEFARYRQTMAVEDCKMATKSVVASKIADINRLLNHQFTNEELTEKLRKQTGGTLDSKTRIFRQIETERQLKAARVAGDDAEVEKLEAQMAELNGPKLAFGTALNKPRAGKQQSEKDRVAELNLRNQKLNTESVRRAQLEEKKASRKAAAAVARGEASANPFMRVRTIAKTHYDDSFKVQEPVSNGDHSGEATPKSTADTPRSNTPNSSARSATQKKTTKGGIATIRHRNMDDENIAALDLELDIEV